MRYEFPDNVLPGRIGLPAWTEEARLSLRPQQLRGAGFRYFQYRQAARTGPKNVDWEGLTVNLTEFIDETLSEILAGIRAAQKRQGGEAVGAKFSLGKVSGSTVGDTNLFHTYDTGAFTVVDFDVLVAAESTKGGKGGIRVMSVGAEGGAERKSHESSRVKFAVPVHIPEGDAQKA
jgi:hypothetical protein